MIAVCNMDIPEVEVRQTTRRILTCSAVPIRVGSRALEGLSTCRVALSGLIAKGHCKGLELPQHHTHV